MMSSNSRASGSSSGGTTTTASSKSSGTRLFVGNLAESVDEYTLIHFLSKHGKISKFDYLFHKAGPRKGRPRGYAFVEYATKEVRIVLRCCRLRAAGYYVQRMKDRC